MAEPDSAGDDTALGVGGDETVVVPDLTPTEQPELAWSDEDEEYSARTWREAERGALGLILAAAAAAAVVVLAWPAGKPTSTTALAPAVDAGITLSGSPAPAPLAPEPAPISTTPVFPTELARHLQPPRPTSGPSADVIYVDALRRSGLIITDVNTAIDGGHAICNYLRQGHSGAAAANIAMSNNHTLRPVDAANFVLAAVGAYCPDATP